MMHGRTRATLRVAGAVVTGLCLWPSPAAAHEPGGLAEGFLSGLGHPLSGLDHMLAMVAVGLWGAQLGAPAMWLLPVTFPLVMALGGLLGVRGLFLPAVEPVIAASALLLGAAVLLAWRPMLAVALALVGVFAVYHGYAHGAELPGAADQLAYGAGFVLSTGTLHVVGIAIGLLHRWAWGTMVVRAAGGVIAVAGVYLLADVLR
jgi:urease accessory protein